MKKAEGLGSEKKENKYSALPFGMLPRGMNRVQSAAYFGISMSLFDAMVKDGRAPQPKLINTQTVWDRHKLDEAFDALPDKATANPWDELYG